MIKLKSFAYWLILAGLVVFPAQILAQQNQDQDVNQQNQNQDNNGSAVNNQGAVIGSGIVIPTNTGLPDGTIASVLSRVLNWLLMIFVVIATISFVVTGLQFIFSFGGSTGAETQARKNFIYTIIAIFVVGGALIILNGIIYLLGGNSSGGVSSYQDNTINHPFN